MHQALNRNTIQGQASCENAFISLCRELCLTHCAILGELTVLTLLFSLVDADRSLQLDCFERRQGHFACLGPAYSPKSQGLEKKKGKKKERKKERKRERERKRDQSSIHYS